MDELVTVIERRSSRGTARGASDVLARARQRVAQQRRRRRAAIVTACAMVASVLVAGLVARDGGDQSRIVAGPRTTVGSPARGPLLVWYGEGAFNVVEADTDKVVFRSSAPGAGCSTCSLVQIGNYVLSAADGVYRLSLIDGSVDRIAAGGQIFLASDRNSVFVVDNRQLSRIDANGKLVGGPWTFPAEYRLTSPARTTASGLLLEWTGDTTSWGRRLAEWNPASSASPVELATFTHLIDARTNDNATTTTALTVANCTAIPCDHSIVIGGQTRVQPPAGTIGFIGGGVFSPDGSTLAAFAVTGERDRQAALVMIDVRAGTATAPIDRSSIRYGEEYGYATWSSDGSAVYFGGLDDPLRRYRLGDAGAEALPWPSNYSTLAATASNGNAPSTTARTATTSSTVAPQLTRCPEPTLKPGTNAAIKFVDFVKLDGITYTNTNPRTATLSDQHLGPQIATVCQSYLTRVAGGESRDGDAAYLEEGTPIYRVNGYDQRFRIAARRDGQIVWFEADTNPAAKVGRDLIDLSQVQTQSIAINDSRDVTIARIDDRPTIERLIELLHQAPVQLSTRAQNGQMYWLKFQLADGTSVNRAFFVDYGEFSRGIQVPQEFTDVIKTTVR